MVLGPTAAVKRIKTFQGALCVLSSLQAPPSSSSESLRARLDDPALQLRNMKSFLLRTGLTVADLDKLNIIHVAGTKGKGSTCAFTERILRSCGFRTGFYSSPHLVHVRERIRINGRPISSELFARCFWETYERLEVTKEADGGAMPFYFQFLTLMAFHVFLQERVDVAVVEVGIGGRYDCTNVIRKPWVCGVSSLGRDHCGLLGDSEEEIAAQKAGIFKPGVPAFTVQQKPESLNVLRRRAAEVGCPLLVCPELRHFGAPLTLGLAGKHQHLNASLALMLSSTWLRRRRRGGAAGGDVVTSDRKSSGMFRPGAAMRRGLRETEWAGRCQTERRGLVTFYLDGAHTCESMEACSQWFREEAELRNPIKRGHKVLIFNTTGERDAAALLRRLLPCSFDVALFCSSVPRSPSDQTKISSSAGQMLARCRENLNIWQHLNAPLAPQQQQPVCRPLVESSGSVGLVLPCVHSALQWIHSRQQAAADLREDCEMSVLVTGSLHLVGGVLEHLDPSLHSS